VVMKSSPSAPQPELETFAPVESSEPSEWLPSDQSSIRVDVRRLDESLEQLSSLFVTRFKLDRVASELGAQGADVRDLKAVIAENTRQLRRLRAAISEARMVPLTELLQRLPLVVRGITNGTDKSVNVTIHAGSAEVDKAVADKIFPAVIHLVRNAVDHAIETRVERRRLGKAEAGELSIVCDDGSGTSLILTVTDDGRGIDRDAVAAKLGRAPARDDDELLQQISTAGLSTSRELTHTSGRGMGMDIVKRTVEVLGGALSLTTEPGKGTTMRLRVPVSVTIVDVFSFLSGGQTFVAPVTVVDEIVEIDPSLPVELPGGGLGAHPRLIQYRGKTIPLFSLEGVLRRDGQTVMPRKAMVVNQGRGTVAFGVDKMLGQQEAVVRPLDDSLIRVAGMAGATDLGDGRPTLVLDLAMMGISVLQKAEATL
jgi:two-component system chemotaxis sensor kinase CheA